MTTINKAKQEIPRELNPEIMRDNDNREKIIIDTEHKFVHYDLLKILMDVALNNQLRIGVCKNKIIIAYH